MFVPATVHRRAPLVQPSEDRRTAPRYLACADPKVAWDIPVGFGVRRTNAVWRCALARLGTEGKAQPRISSTSSTQAQVPKSNIVNEQQPTSVDTPVDTPVDSQGERQGRCRRARLGWRRGQRCGGCRRATVCTRRSLERLRRHMLCLCIRLRRSFAREPEVLLRPAAVARQPRGGDLPSAEPHLRRAPCPQHRWVELTSLVRAFSGHAGHGCTPPVPWRAHHPA